MFAVPVSTLQPLGATRDMDGPRQPRISYCEVRATTVSLFETAELGSIHEILLSSFDQ